MYDYDNEDLKIYFKVNEFIKEGLVLPYDDELLYFLANFTDKKNKNIKNYLKGLKSTYSISKCYRFSRYLALGMNQPFHLYKGKLNKLHKGDFPHSWIETEDYVYDTAFPGKWPKKLYYQLFEPIIENEIDLETDEKYLEFKANNSEAETPDDIPFLKYIDWYNYTSHANIPSPYFSFEPNYYYFPQDVEKVAKLNFVRLIENEWNDNKINADDEIPYELFSQELSDFIERGNYIKGKEPLYRELIRFIINNRDLYEEKKKDETDITLWKKAIEGKYSGSFCLLISNLPTVFTQIKDTEENLKTTKL